MVVEEEEEGMRLVDGVGKTVLSGPACARSVLCRGAFRKDPSGRQGREPERNVGRRSTSLGLSLPSFDLLRSRAALGHCLPASEELGRLRRAHILFRNPAV
jgi:hypothetical protein